ncbi:MAG: transaldolase family protein [Pseudomonadota bacterium]
MSKHVLERLAETNPEAEIWWDSSPLIYPSWKAETLAKAPDAKRAEWTEQLTRMYDNETIHEHGTMGFRGVTTNPPLSLQAIQLAPELWRAEIKKIAADNPGLDVEGVYWKMYLDLVKKGASAIHRVYETSGGKYGMLSGQVDPRFVTDGDKMLAQGLSIAAMGENVMVKLPGSKEGYEVLEELTARGISTNNTTSFTVSQYGRCMAAVTAGLQRARAAGVDLSKYRSVITHMSSRLGQLSDWQREAKLRGIELSMMEIRDGEEAVLKRAYWFGKSINHPSKMLQCSMRVEKDDYGNTVSRHIQDFGGSDMVYTCPPGYIAQCMDAEEELTFDPKAIEREPNPKSIEKLMKLPSFRAAYEFEGQKPHEFSQFGAFQATATEFALATRQTVDFVRMVVEG